MVFYGVMEPAVFLEENLKQIEAAIRSLCVRHRMMHGDCEELSAHITVKLIEHDYQIIRRFGSRSSFKTYLYTVVSRLYIDYVRQTAGRWRPSEQAKKNGTIAVKLEELLCRDNYTFEEAFNILTTNHHISVTRDELHSMALSLPHKAFQRMTDAGEEPLAEVADIQGRPDTILLKGAVSGTREKLERIIEDMRLSMSSGDRLILKMRFEDDLTVSQIARTIGVDRNSVDRRLKAVIDRFKEGILAKGISGDDARDLLDSLEP